jgi:hypothetical protein
MLIRIDMNFHDKPPLLPLVFKAGNWIGGQGTHPLPFTKGVPRSDPFSKPHLRVWFYAYASEAAVTHWPGHRPGGPVGLSSRTGVHPWQIARAGHIPARFPPGLKGQHASAAKCFKCYQYLIKEQMEKILSPTKASSGN